MEDPTTSGPSSLDHAAQARALTLVGQVIAGRYRLDALLAVGGMGAVYRGRHQLLKKRVAIKVLRPDTENLPELVARFEREAIAGAHVVHANVAAATDFGQLDDGSYFLVLEYVSGRTLHDVIREDAPVPPRRAVRIVREIAEALAATHAMGIVHRDVKPRNVMLVAGAEEHAKLIDFGFAKVPVDRVVQNPSKRPPVGSAPEVRLDGLAAPRAPRMRVDSLLEDAPRLTGVGMIVGTVSYLAPEAVHGMDAVDARADLYALGLLLYQLLAGKHPFEAEDDAAMFAHQRLTLPPAFAERVSGLAVPSGLEGVVMKLLEKEPAARYASAKELIEALDFALHEVAPVPRAGPVKSWRGFVPLGVGGLALGIGVAAALLVHASSSGPRADLARDGARVSRVTAAAATSGEQPAAPPVPSPSASAASASASSSAAAPGDAHESPRAALVRSLRVRDLPNAEAAFLDIADHDPESLREPELSLATRDLAVALDRDGQADRLFDRLTTKLGPVGLDLLYDLVATRGRASAAIRAAAILRKPGTMEHATPELRIAFELRDAPCLGKLALLDRAVAQGDARALVVLETQGVSCFRKNNRGLQESMAALRAKLRRAP